MLEPLTGRSVPDELEQTVGFPVLAYEAKAGRGYLLPGHRIVPKTEDSDSGREFAPNPGGLLESAVTERFQVDEDHGRLELMAEFDRSAAILRLADDRDAGFEGQQQVEATTDSPVRSHE
jgi:hypothetical protein